MALPRPANEQKYDCGTFWLARIDGRLQVVVLTHQRGGKKYEAVLVNAEHKQVYVDEWGLEPLNARAYLESYWAKKVADSEHSAKQSQYYLQEYQELEFAPAVNPGDA